MEQIIKIGLATIFGLVAIAKLSGKSKEIFEKTGYTRARMYTSTFAEVLCSVGFFTQYDLWALFGFLTIIVKSIRALIILRVRPAKYGMAVLPLDLLLTLMISRMANR